MLSAYHDKIYSFSSASPVNFVVKEPSITAHPSYMDYSNLGDHVSYIVLDEALEGSSNLILQCRLKQIGVADIGARICGSDGSPIGGALVIMLSDITIQLRESQITFRVIITFNDICNNFKSLVLARERPCSLFLLVHIVFS